MIRDPFDWYCSYHAFMRKNLSQWVQSEVNFPKSHPIAFFSDSGDQDVLQMLRRMLVVDANSEEGIGPAMIYGSEIPGVFDFMSRTGFGFWTWTVMYHFSEKAPHELSDKDAVLVEATKIARHVKFIRQESIDEDVGLILGLRPRVGARLNVSQVISVIDEEGQVLARQLDGPTADIVLPH